MTAPLSARDSQVFATDLDKTKHASVTSCAGLQPEATSIGPVRALTVDHVNRARCLLTSSFSETMDNGRTPAMPPGFTQPTCDPLCIIRPLVLSYRPKFRGFFLGRFRARAPGHRTRNRRRKFRGGGADHRTAPASCVAASRRLVLGHPRRARSPAPSARQLSSARHPPAPQLPGVGTL